MILEGLVTTLRVSGELNVAPVGPIVDESMAALQFRLFRTSTTYRNFKDKKSGVFHVVDDVLLLARSAIGRLAEPLETFPAKRIDGLVLKQACRWYEFEIDSIDETTERANMFARVVYAGRIRDFFGFNRAKHAVVEAAILATRVHLLPRDEIRRQLAALRIPVEKTAGPREVEAFELIEDYVAQHDFGR